MKAEVERLKEQVAELEMVKAQFAEIEEYKAQLAGREKEVEELHIKNLSTSQDLASVQGRLLWSEQN